MTGLRGWVAMALVASLGACGGKDVGPPAATGEPAKVATKPADAPSEVVTEAGAMKVYDLAALQDKIRGSGAKVTLVAVWATWCMPCIEEMPVLSAYFEKHRDEGFRVIGLCTDDRADQAEKIQAVLDRTKVKYEQGLMLPGGEDAFFAGVGQEWDGQLPKGVVFDAAGKPVGNFSEAITAEALAAKIAPLLAK